MAAITYGNHTTGTSIYGSGNTWTTSNNSIYVYNNSTDTTTSYSNSGVSLQIKTINTPTYTYNTPKFYTKVSDGALKVDLGTEVRIDLPDGTRVRVSKDGSYKIIDKNAKVTYQQTPAREFNKFINASDILEDFVKYLGEIGARQQDVLEVPIEVFIHWLVIEAAKADGDEPPKDVQALPPITKHDCRCVCCGKFITKEKHGLGINFCSANHLETFMNKKGVGVEYEEEEAKEVIVEMAPKEKQFVTISAVH